MLCVMGRQAVWPARWGRLEAVWVDPAVNVRLGQGNERGRDCVHVVAVEKISDCRLQFGVG